MIKKAYLFATIVVLLLLSDCGCMRKRVVIKSILLEMPTSARGIANPLDREKFAIVVEETIKKNPYFRYENANQEGVVLRLTLVPPEEKSSGATLMLVATLTKAHNAGEYSSFVDINIIKGSISGKDIKLALDKVLENLYLIQSGSSVDNQLYLDRIQAKIAGESLDPGELINAISVLGETREKQAIEPLISLLSTTTDLAVGNACLIALSRLSAPEAMPAIIDFVERKPSIIRRQGIIAARSIASKLAAEWLFVMAYGYDDPVVRKEALEALKDVEEKLAHVSN